MEENLNMSEVINEIKNANEDELRELIEDWFESTRTASMRIGANYIAVAVYDAINKNLNDGMNSSHRDFKRAIKKILEIISVQLKRQETIQNDLNGVMGETVDD